MFLVERVLGAVGGTLHLLHHALILGVRSEILRSNLVLRAKRSERTRSPASAQSLIADKGRAALVTGSLEDALVHQRHLPAVIVRNGQVLRAHVVDVRCINVYDDLSRDPARREELLVAPSLINQVQG